MILFTLTSPSFFSPSAGGTAVTPSARRLPLDPDRHSAEPAASDGPRMTGPDSAGAAPAHVELVEDDAAPAPRAAGAFAAPDKAAGAAAGAPPTSVAGAVFACLSSPHVLLLVVALELADFITDVFMVASYRRLGEDDLFIPGVLFILLPALLFSCVHFHSAANSDEPDDDDQVIGATIFKWLSPVLFWLCCPLVVVVLPCIVSLRELRNARYRSKHHCCTLSFCLWRANSYEETAGNTNTDIGSRAVAAAVFAAFQNVPQLVLAEIFVLRRGGSPPLYAVVSMALSAAMIAKSVVLWYLSKRQREEEEELDRKATQVENGEVAGEW